MCMCVCVCLFVICSSGRDNKMVTDWIHNLKGPAVNFDALSEILAQWSRLGKDALLSDLTSVLSVDRLSKTVDNICPIHAQLPLSPLQKVILEKICQIVLLQR
eukprot:Lankesteria_metandrocarpae@DN1486_c0_g1_i2.p1